MELKGTISEELLIEIDKLCNNQQLDKKSKTYNNLTDKEKKIINLLHGDTLVDCWGRLSKNDIILNVLVFMKTGEYNGMRMNDIVLIDGNAYFTLMLIDPHESCANKYIVPLVSYDPKYIFSEDVYFQIGMKYRVPFVNVWLYKQALKEHDDSVLRCVSKKICAVIEEKYDVFRAEVIISVEKELSVEEWE